MYGLWGDRCESALATSGHAPLALPMVMQGVSANFAPHFAPSPAPVAQGIEQRFPKPQVACSIHAGSTKGRLAINQSAHNVSDWIRYGNGHTDH